MYNTVIYFPLYTFNKYLHKITRSLYRFVFNFKIIKHFKDQLTITVAYNRKQSREETKIDNTYNNKITRTH